MIVHRAIIRGYRSIRECEMRATSFQVLLGRNNSGKSNVLRALRLFFENEDVSVNDFHQEEAGKRAEELSITVTFTHLTDEERKEFQKYVLKDGTMTISKIARLDGPLPSKPVYHGIRLMPSDKRLRPETYEGTPKENLEALEKEFGDLSHHRPPNTRISASSFAATIENLVQANRDKLTFVEELEPTQFMGWKNVASGKLGLFLMVPAIPDPRSEAEMRKGSRLADIVSPMLESIIQEDPEYGRAVEMLAEATQKMAKQMPDGSPNSRRPTELSDIEADIEQSLRDWQIKVMLQVSPVGLGSSLIETDVVVDDGHASSVDMKGHGLQRAFIVAVLNVWKERILLSSSKNPEKLLKSILLAIEEPELYLHPQQQRAFFRTLNEISKTDNHQVIVSSHSPFFIDMDDPLSISCIVKKSVREGTKVVQLDRHPFEGDGKEERKRRFQTTQWFDPSRGEVFFAEKVVLVEGPTEKVALPYVATRIGVFRPSVTLVDCGGKPNMPLFMKVLNDFRIPYVVVYDEDPIEEAVPDDRDHEHKLRMFKCNEEIESLAQTPMSLCMISPDFDRLVGVSDTSMKTKGKPLAVFDYLVDNGVPPMVEELVRRIYAGEVGKTASCV